MDALKRLVLQRLQRDLLFLAACSILLWTSRVRAAHVTRRSTWSQCRDTIVTGSQIPQGVCECDHARMRVFVKPLLETRILH